MIAKQVDGTKEEISGVGYQAQLHLSPFNNRLVIKDYQGQNIAKMLNRIIELAAKHNFTKIWVKAYQTDRESFSAAGFKTEAVIDDYYLQTDAVSMAYYLSPDRNKLVAPQQEDKIIDQLSTEKSEAKRVNLPAEYKFKLAAEEDLSNLASLYDKVFASYPYPIDKEEYLRQMLAEDVIYGLVYANNDLVAAAAAETVPAEKNAEMTDFATLAAYRGQGLASYLLKRLEDILTKREYNCLYTIARAKIVGINKLFSQADYKYRGRLVKNCNIGGGLEDMNLWVKTVN